MVLGSDVSDALVMMVAIMSRSNVVLRTIPLEVSLAASLQPFGPLGDPVGARITPHLDVAGNSTFYLGTGAL